MPAMDSNTQFSRENIALGAPRTGKD